MSHFVMLVLLPPDTAPEAVEGSVENAMEQYSVYLMLKNTKHRSAKFELSCRQVDNEYVVKQKDSAMNTEASKCFLLLMILIVVIVYSVESNAKSTAEKH